MIQDRIKELIQLLELSFAEFASQIGVQSSSISHLASGRNKPSLDFLEKLHKAYPDLNTNWLIYGEGSPFINSKNSGSPTPLIPEDEIKKKIKEDITIEREKTRAQESEYFNRESEKKATEDSRRLEKSIKKVIILYNDGTFEEKG